ncbi:transposase [Micromonospora sp. KC207]|uniref:transposase n=1 Tax=Micromonospora sp. KC207 TaxID=2530377 RepID=UPI0021101B82|nr:transposase [Micromonospora sp. KC207]
MLRLIRSQRDHPSVRGPRVLGVNDFVLKRGHVYGMVLIDIEAGHPIDVLPDRTSGTLAAWLREHPGIEIICRDRASSYAEAARTAAPDAVQIANRFHLWRNLCQAVEKVAAAHRNCLAPPNPKAEDEPPQPRAAPIPEQLQGPLAARTRDRHAAVHELRRAGVNINAIAENLGLDRKTIRRYAQAETADDLLSHGRLSSTGRALHPYLTHIH